MMRQACFDPAQFSLALRILESKCLKEIENCRGAVMALLIPHDSPKGQAEADCNKMVKSGEKRTALV